MEILIGTSGWVYKEWNERFYPKGTKDKDKLGYLAQHFPTVEINSSFYRMPTKAVFTVWHERAPEEFIFSLKFPRYITQMKKLILDEQSKSYINDFIKNSKALNNQLGAVLIQLPPNFGYDLERLAAFIKYLLSYAKKSKYKADFCIEFRNDTWFNDDVFNLMRKYNIGFVIADSSVWPQDKVFTADFSYIRFHGPVEMFASSYANRQLDRWAEFIVSQRNIKRVYVYFNNDMSAKAIENAKYLQKCINKLLKK
jgi:uncharacterized protein YecE (DUF72 family)